jgi:hypothetical protein
MEIVGLTAAACVLATFCMQSMTAFARVCDCQQSSLYRLWSCSRSFADRAVARHSFADQRLVAWEAIRRSYCCHRFRSLWRLRIMPPNSPGDVQHWVATRARYGRRLTYKIMQSATSTKDDKARPNVRREWLCAAS